MTIGGNPLQEEFIPKLRYRYQTKDFGDFEIHLRTLKDKQQYSDDHRIAEQLGISSAQWPIFGVIWDSAQVLAHHMADFEIKGKRILEVGCGTALASHVLNHRLADISATDVHPEVETFLIENARINACRDIPFQRLNWSQLKSNLGTFDLIIGSDLLYENGVSADLSRFIISHANEACEVVIVDPGRGYQNQFIRHMEKQSFIHHKHTPKTAAYLEAEFQGFIHSFYRKRP